MEGEMLQLTHWVDTIWLGGEELSCRNHIRKDARSIERYGDKACQSWSCFGEVKMFDNGQSIAINWEILTF